MKEEINHAARVVADRRTQVYDLLLGAQGLSALALTMKLQRMWPDWKMQNTYNTVSYMSRRNEAKKLNGLWYAGEKNPSRARGRGRPRANGVHREAVLPTIINIEQAPSGEFDFDAALRLIEGALQAARNIVLQAKNSALDKKQQHARLEAILKLARNQE